MFRNSIFFLVILPLLLSACKTNAIYFDGKDDAIDLGNVYDSTQLPVSMSAWIRVDANATGQNPIFVSQSTDSLYDGFWLIINPSHLFSGYGDGLGENHPAFRKDKSSPHTYIFDQWIHVASVVQSHKDIEVYLNGQLLPGAYYGDTANPMGSNFPHAKARIGYWFSNGSAFWFKGAMDDLKIWNRPLTPEEIRADFEKAMTFESTSKGLIGHWDFNEAKNQKTVKDKSGRKIHGRFVGNPQRIKADFSERRNNTVVPE